MFENELNSQPIYVILNEDQSTGMVASFNDVLYINFAQDVEYDIDEHFQISNIRSIIYSTEEQKYYLLANKCQELIGYYVIELEESELNQSILCPNFLMNHKSKLDIGDADLHLVDDQERGLK